MFSLKECDAIGFDMDHTLCRYVLSTQIELGHQALAQYLVKEKKYPKRLADPVLDDPNLVYCGGLLFDGQHKALVKMDENGKVEKAAFGTEMISDSEISKLYSSDMYCSHYSKVLSGTLSEKGVYHLHDNNFDMTLTVLLSRMMEIAEKQNNETKLNVFADFYEGISHAWDAASFSGGNSMFFEELKSNPGKYLHKCPDVVKTWLKALKAEGKVLFLLTSSHCDFAKHVMDYCFEDDWRSYFDVVISKAKKPRFFNEQFPFKVVDPDHVCELATEALELELNGWYSEGSSHVLHEHLKKWSGKESAKVVYFGDSVKSDIVPAKQKCDWEAVYIMDALRAEKGALNPLSGHEKSLLFSEGFGPLLKSTNGTGTCNSFFCKLIEKYATIAMPSVEYMASLPIDFQYSRLGNGNGYYPGKPNNM
uniref:5'-nucleotidase domain-containing protein 1-like n=1 Tax=Ciona intestinalis TaxID=7719 RepID=UPI000180CA37|nr:5'-nucleotidase domain-containing protein 1-like [Ciona intestinalis]|eukprot:XP_002127635.1 5'-nucleotidase domain-containing protein 1-like [Ciona intestinalis]